MLLQLKIVEMSKVTIAFVGCGHGELDLIYDTIKKSEEKKNVKVDLCIISGDFNASRNMGDLNTMACPDKYKSMLDFHKYYSGELKAPVLTLVIGGNHEASNHFLELYYGGWIAENIYYLGQSGCVRFKGLKIAGISGIFKNYHYRCGYFEKFPFNNDHMRSIYHYRSYEVSKLSYLHDVDIFVSHDWPRNIWRDEVRKRTKNRQQHQNNQKNYNNNNRNNRFVPNVLKLKEHIHRDIVHGKLGSPPLLDLCNVLKPRYWISAHLHQYLHLNYYHGPPPQKQQNNNNEEKRVYTHFIALDKALPRKSFLRIIEVSTKTENENMNQPKEETWGENEEDKRMKDDDEEEENVRKKVEDEEEEEEVRTKVENEEDKRMKDEEEEEEMRIKIEDEDGEEEKKKEDNDLYYDDEWLSILIASHQYFSLGQNILFPLPPSEVFSKEIDLAGQRVRELRDGQGGEMLKIDPSWFTRISKKKQYKKKKQKMDRGRGRGNYHRQQKQNEFYRTKQGERLNNPQRTKFLEMLGGLEDYISFMCDNVSKKEKNPERIVL